MQAGKRGSSSAMPASQSFLIIGTCANTERDSSVAASQELGRQVAALTIRVQDQERQAAEHRAEIALKAAMMAGSLPQALPQDQAGAPPAGPQVHPPSSLPLPPALSPFLPLPLLLPPLSLFPLSHTFSPNLPLPLAPFRK